MEYSMFEVVNNKFRVFNSTELEEQIKTLVFGKNEVTISRNSFTKERSFESSIGDPTRVLDLILHEQYVLAR